jgi:O-antigen/teichoic acid export membrane protein
MAARQELAVIKILAWALLCDVVTSLLLVPRYRETGTALAALSASLCAAVGTGLKTAQWVRLLDLRRIARIGLATVLMSAGAFAVRSAFGMWAAAGSGVVLYLGLLLALRVATVEDIVRLLRRKPIAAETASQLPPCAAAGE